MPEPALADVLGTVRVMIRPAPSRVRNAKVTSTPRSSKSICFSSRARRVTRPGPAPPAVGGAVATPPASPSSCARVTRPSRKSIAQPPRSQNRTPAADRTARDCSTVAGSRPRHRWLERPHARRAVTVGSTLGFLAAACTERGRSDAGQGSAQAAPVEDVAAPQGPVDLAAYQLGAAPASRSRLPAELHEISGLAVTADGRVFAGTTVYDGAVALRPAIVNWRTEEEDVDLLVEVVRELVAEETRRT